MNSLNYTGELSPLQEELAKIHRNSESSLAEFAARESSLEKSRLSVTDAEHRLQKQDGI